MIALIQPIWCSFVDVLRKLVRVFSDIAKFSSRHKLARAVHDIAACAPRRRVNLFCLNFLFGGEWLSTNHLMRMLFMSRAPTKRSPWPAEELTDLPCCITARLALMIDRALNPAKRSGLKVVRGKCRWKAEQTADGEYTWDIGQAQLRWLCSVPTIRRNSRSIWVDAELACIKLQNQGTVLHWRLAPQSKFATFIEYQKPDPYVMSWLCTAFLLC